MTVVPSCPMAALKLVLLIQGSLLFGLSSTFFVHSFVTPTATRIRQQQQQQQQQQRQNFYYQTFSPSTTSSLLTSQARDDGDDTTTNTTAAATTTNVNQKYNISLLLIDHYDSFTYNLYDMLAQLTVEPPQVIAKDALPSYNQDDWKHIDGIILSPGPGTPQEQPPLSHQSIVANPDLPILGVCLGHQLLALSYGGDVGKAPEPIHGQDHWISTTTMATTTTTNDKDNDNNNHKNLFDSLPNSFRVVRYHSLAASNLPVDELQVTATSPNDNVIQAMQHVTNPHYGVQFHPESIGSQYGMALLDNFCQIVLQEKKKKKNNKNREEKPTIENDSTNEEEEEVEEGPILVADPTINASNDEDETSKSKPKFRVLLHPVSKTITNGAVKPSTVFSEFYSDQPTAMWLDSSSYPSRGDLDIMAAPLSMNDSDNDDDDIIEYHYDPENENGNDDVLSQLEEKLAFAYDMDIGFVAVNNNGGDGANDGDDRHHHHHHHEDTIEWTKDTSVAAAGENVESTSSSQTNHDGFPKIPFDYRGGYLGYLGYEVRHDTQRYLREQESCHLKKEEKDNSDQCQPQHRSKKQTKQSDSSPSPVPTAAFFLARESMIYHHPTQQWYLLGLVDDDESVKARVDWIKRTEARMAELSMSIGEEELCTPQTTSVAPPAFVPNRPKERYAQDIDDCHEFIRAGESYELCLTNQLEATVTKDGDKDDATTTAKSTLDLYQRLRRKNPAPYAAYFTWKDDMAICCSSPERFMSVQRRPTNNHPHHPTMVLQAEAKPIKGTCARVIPADGIRRTQAETREDERRARSLELSLKNRAENLMIVDLLRNDMSRVCQIGSVHVAKLMDIESFATVHQMVSTIRGTLTSSSSNSGANDVNGTIDLLRASFPGGSMTGAPKIRTMELLEELEDHVDRGPYSGSLGYLSINGCMDMNIIIRSAVVVANKDRLEHKVSIGAGGAITALSEVQDEYDEMLLKARAVVESVQEWACERRMPAASVSPPLQVSDAADIEQPALRKS